jgi:hypothetical protein
MSRGDLAEAASKYVWGLRPVSDLGITALGVAVIAASCGGQEAYDDGLARIRPVLAQPTDSSGLRSVIEDILGASTTS